MGLPEDMVSRCRRGRNAVEGIFSIRNEILDGNSNSGCVGKWGIWELVRSSKWRVILFSNVCSLLNSLVLFVLVPSEQFLVKFKRLELLS